MTDRRKERDRAQRKRRKAREAKVKLIQHARACPETSGPPPSLPNFVRVSYQPSLGEPQEQVVPRESLLHTPISEVSGSLRNDPDASLKPPRGGYAASSVVSLSSTGSRDLSTKVLFDSKRRTTLACSTPTPVSTASSTSAILSRTPVPAKRSEERQHRRQVPRAG